MKTPGSSRSPWMYFPLPEFPPLAASTRAEVCVVGAGIAAVTTAYLLAKKGRRVVVLAEAGLGSGTTARTTAHLSSAIGGRYREIERVHGEAGARLAAESHRAAIDAIAAMVAHENIDCDFARLDGYLFLPREGGRGELHAEHAAALRAGVEEVQWAARAPVAGFDTGPCLRFAGQGQFHPLKYLAGLAQALVGGGGIIHGATRVRRVEGGASPRVRSEAGHVIECSDVVVASETPLAASAAMPARAAPGTTYAIAARVARGSVPQVLLWDTPEACHRVRLDQPGGELLVVGGEDRMAGAGGDAAERFGALERWMRARFPAAREVVHRWSGPTLETTDGLALLGRVPGEDHVFVATADAALGMTHGTIGAILITDLIHGAEVPWARLYDPARGERGGALQRGRGSPRTRRASAFSHPGM